VDKITLLTVSFVFKKPMGLKVPGGRAVCHSRDPREICGFRVGGLEDRKVIGGR